MTQALTKMTITACYFENHLLPTNMILFRVRKPQILEMIPPHASLDEESITTPATVLLTPSDGPISSEKSRAQQQRCQKRTYQIGFMAVILVLILSVTLGVTIGHHSTNQQQQVATIQPAKPVLPREHQ
jgi:hypothetical protein